MKRSAITIIFTILIISVIWMLSSRSVNEKTLEVYAVYPVKKDICDYINANGKIREGNKQNIYADNVVKVEKIYVKPGDVVDENTILAEVTPLYADKVNFINYFPDTSLIESVFSEYDIDLAFDKPEKTAKGTTTSIKSPINGTITSLNIKEGDIVTAFNKLISVSDLSDLYIQAMIPEEYSLKVAEEQSVNISAEAFGCTSYDGKIDYISPVAKYFPSLTGEGKTYIEAIIKVDNPSLALRPGLTVNTKIATNVVKNALTLPYECIMQDENNQEYVFCINNGQAEKRYVDVGYELSDMVEIKRGISLYDKVIQGNQEEIKEDAFIKEVMQ